MQGLNDDDPIIILSSRTDMVRHTATILKGFGFTNVVSESNGIKAMKSFIDKSFSLIICDMSVKFINGWALVKEIKLSEKIPNIPSILMGQAEAPAVDDDLKQYGIVEYLKEPYKAGDVSFLINSTLQLFHTSGTVENKYTKAKSALMSEKSDEAVQLYDELRGLTNKGSRASVGLAEAYVQMNETEKAKEVILNINQAEKLSPGAIMMQVKVLLQSDSSEKAFELTHSLLTEIAPDLPYYYSKSLGLYLKSKELEKSQKICEMGIAKKFKMHEFSEELAKIMYRQKQYRECCDFIEEVEETLGISHDLLSVRGACMKNLGNYRSALRAYEQALELRPMNSNMLFNLAIVSIVMKNYSQAKTYLESSINITPGFKRARDKLAELDIFIDKQPSDS